MTTTTPRPQQPTAQDSANSAPRKRPRRLSPGALFVVPAVAFFLAFLVIPIVYTIYLSSHGMQVLQGQAYGVKEQVFLGFENYLSALTDADLGSSLLRMLLYAIIMVPIMMFSAMLFALLLDSPKARLVGLSRTMIFLPYAIPGVIATLMWGFLYLKSTSPAVWLAGQVGIVLPDVLSGNIIYLSLANISIWSGVGFNMIIMYTSLRSVPKEIYDAARVDGCNEMQISVRIKIPYLMPAIALTGLFSIIGALQAYSEPVTLAALTPAIGSTFFPMMTVYSQAFESIDLNLAAATSIVLAVGTLLVSLLVLRVMQSRNSKGAS